MELPDSWARGSGRLASHDACHSSSRSGWQGDASREAFGLFLGHVRLSVVDLDGGHQPMWNENGSIGVSFNGEIYNPKNFGMT